MNLIEVSGLKKGFSGQDVLTDVSFTVKRGDVIAVIGPSGAGKSTMLRCSNLLNIPMNHNMINDHSYNHIPKSY